MFRHSLSKAIIYLGGVSHGGLKYYHYTFSFGLLNIVCAAPELPETLFLSILSKLGFSCVSRALYTVAPLALTLLSAAAAISPDNSRFVCYWL